MRCWSYKSIETPGGIEVLMGGPSLHKVHI